MEEQASPTPQIFSCRFDDFSAFSEAAAGWEIDFRQLDRGAFHGRMVQVFSPSALLSEVRLGRKLHQLGASPKGHWTFGIPIGPGMRYQWRGQAVAANQIIGFDSSTEMDSISEIDFHLFAFSVSYEHATRICADTQIPPLEETVGHASIATCSPESIAAIRSAAADAMASAQLPSPGIHADHLDLLVGLIGQAFDRPGRRESHPAHHGGRALRQAISIIHDRAHEPISITELYRLSNASGRTLRYAFENAFGISPKAYLQAYRLNMVRSMLLDHDARSKGAISDAANAWGFWHLGQFAADYRQMFDELPSETLANRGR